MNNKKTGFVIGLVVLIIVLVIVFMQSQKTNTAGDENTSSNNSSVVENNINPNTPVGTTTTTTTTTSNTTSTGVKTYTLADVATHNSQSNCWTAVNGAVYNVTSWISQHPGGARAIISMCGIDGSDAFNGQHGGQRRPASELVTFKIGDLK